MVDRRGFLATASCGTIAALFARPALAATSWPIPPQVPRHPVAAGAFGATRNDDYLWLRTDHWHAVLTDPASLEPAIKAVVEAENRYSDTMLAPTMPLQAALRDRAAAIEPAPPVPLAVQDGDFLYFTRQSAEAPYPTYLRRRLTGGAEQVVFDPAERAAGHRFYALHWDGARHSPDGRLVGWAEDLAGSGQFRIRAREIDGARMIVDDLDQAHGSFAFDAAGRYLFWVSRNAAGRPDAVWRRDLANGTDAKVLDNPDLGLFIGLSTTASGAFIVINLTNGGANESHLVSATEPTAAPVLVEPRVDGVHYTVDHWNGRLLILTDADDAPDMKVMTAPVDRPGRTHWRELVPHRPGRSIVALHPFRDRLVRVEWRDALPRLVLMWPDGRERDFAFDEPAYALDVPTGQGWNSAAFTFGYESPRLQRRTQRIVLETGALEGDAAVSHAGFDPQRYSVERFAVPSTDGVEVPVTVLRLKDAPRDGRRPLYLYAYGSYGEIEEARFDAANLALVEQSWTYAIAHVRGGGERGSGWWRQVLRTGKKRSFEDYLACADHLVRHGYTAAGRIVAEGFSAGGLLIGTAFVERPDLFAGIIGRSAFLDPLGELDLMDIHPLGGSAIPIWGDPRIPAEYDYIRSYSPYDNLRTASYPALLAMGSLADDRVMYTDALKFAVRARALTTGHQPIMTRIASVGGHVGLPGRAAEADRQALFHAFAIWAADRKWGEVPQR